MNKMMFAILLCCGFSSTNATTIVPEYIDADGEGFFDETPVSPISGNPEATLGGQRRYVFEHGLELLSRVFWVPNTVDLPVRASVMEFGSGFFGMGGPTTSYPKSNEEYGLLQDVDYGNPALSVLSGGESWLNRPSWRNDFGFIFLSDSYLFTRSVDFSEGDRWSYLPIILHEGLHVFGFLSAAGRIGEPPSPSSEYIVNQRNYDRFVRHLGAEVEVPADMTMEQQEAMRFGGDDVVFIGDQARAHSSLLMPQGYDSQGNVILYALNPGESADNFISNPVSHIDMHNLPDVTENLMAPAAGKTLELGIVAYIFSDMGYGPVVDTSVSSSSANVNSLSIETQALVSDLVAIPDDQVEQIAVSIVLPEGLSFGAFTADPATCVVDEDNAQKAVCTYGQLLINTPSMMEVALVGDDGVYTVELDIEHQAMHVDGVPANNFFSASVVMGVNPLSDFVLSSALVESDVAEGAVIGTFSVSNTSAEAVAYTLLNGEGVLSLLGADVVASDALTSADNGTYSLTVQARTPTGYALESVFDVVVSINPITNVALTSSTITQNTSAGSVVGTLSANHALDGEVNFSLVDGVTDNAGFEIDGDEVKTSESLARSDNGTYSLVVVASDGEYSVERTVTVVVNIPALVTPEPPSSGGGGGCTVGAPGQSDGSLPLLMLGLALMWIRRRMIG